MFLGERYQLLEPMNRNGIATIYRGRDLQTDRIVAIKVFNKAYSTDQAFVQRFQQVAMVAAALEHPNIVQGYTYGQTDDAYYIVMELVEGTDLRRYLRSRGQLASDRAAMIAHDIALGLGVVHRLGIVHKNVNSQHILVGRDGSIKLLPVSMAFGVIPQYYAPEQLQDEAVTPSTDVYSLGIVLYEMLTGRTPFDGDTPVTVAMQNIYDAPVLPSQLNPNITLALEVVVLCCLKKVPAMRYQDGAQLALALDTL